MREMNKLEFLKYYSKQLESYNDEQKDMFWKIYNEDPLQFDESMINVETLK